MEDKIRLQKYLAECGIASRRKAEELIAGGQVRVNGQIARIGDSIQPYRDTVTVGGQKIRRERTQRYIMLHKPRGYVTTMTDEHGRHCVAELVADIPERVYPVGRLDRNSEGLLLLTNDGAFANAMMHPKYHIPKTYRVTVRPGITEIQLDKLRTGILIEGKMTAPADVSVVLREPERLALEIVLYEGRNRQIRKMLEALGLEALRLVRKAVGPLKLGMLPQGQWRELTEQEVNSLLRAAGLGPGKKG